MVLLKWYLILNWEKDENKIKRGRDWPILNHVGTFYDSPSLTLFVSYYLFLNSIHSLTVQSHSLSLTFSHTIQYLSVFYLSPLLFITQKHFLHFTFSLSFARFYVCNMWAKRSLSFNRFSEDFFNIFYDAMKRTFRLAENSAQNKKQKEEEKCPIFRKCSNDIYRWSSYWPRDWDFKLNSAQLAIISSDSGPNLVKKF